MDRSYYYMGGDALHTGIYVDIINGLEAEGLTVNFIARSRVHLSPFSAWRAWRTRNMLGPNRTDALRRQLPGSMHVIPIWSILPGLSVAPLARALGSDQMKHQWIVLHARQYVMVRLALALKRWWPGLRVIAEIEGDILAELEYKNTRSESRSALADLRWRLERRFYFNHENDIAHHSDAMVCVSSKLRDVLAQRYGLSEVQAKRILVFPSGASRRKFYFDPAKREQIREALGLRDRFVVVYSGNLGAAWQVPQKLVEAFLYARDRRPNAYFLVLTPERDWDQIVPYLERTGLPAADYGVLACEHAKVVDHLCAGDVGLLLRDRHPMNEAAAPGKFAEYVLAGLPIIMTEGIGDYSARMRDSEFACVLPDLVDMDAMREGIQHFCSKDFTLEQKAALGCWAADQFSTELWVQRLAALYREV